MNDDDDDDDDDDDITEFCTTEKCPVMSAGPK